MAREPKAKTRIEKILRGEEIPPIEDIDYFLKERLEDIDRRIDEGGGGGGLPEITSEDEGKVLTVENGEAVWTESTDIPTPSQLDDGKVLTAFRQNVEWRYPSISLGLDYDPSLSSVYVSAAGAGELYDLYYSNIPVNRMLSGLRYSDEYGRGYTVSIYNPSDSVKQLRITIKGFLPLSVGGVTDFYFVETLGIIDLANRPSSIRFMLQSVKNSEGTAVTGATYQGTIRATLNY